MLTCTVDSESYGAVVLVEAPWKLGEKYAVTVRQGVLRPGLKLRPDINALIPTRTRRVDDASTFRKQSRIVVWTEHRFATIRLDSCCLNKNLGLGCSSGFLHLQRYHDAADCRPDPTTTCDM